MDVFCLVDDYFSLHLRCVEDILDCLRQQCPWLRSMTWQLSARCDLCVGESDGPDGCSWHRASCCLHPDCAHFISLDSADPLRCDHTLKLNTRLDEDKLKPWLKVSKDHSMCFVYSSR